MKKIYIHVFSLFVISCLVAVPSYARVRTKQSEREFDQQVSRSRLMVVMFYRSNNDKGSAERNDMNQLLRMYEKVSSKKLYDDADVTFVKVNVDMRGSDVLARRYGIVQFPSFIVIDRQQAVMDKDGHAAQLVGFVSAHDIQKFIEQSCGDSIRAAVIEKEQKREQRIKDAKNESDPYFYPAVVYTQSGDTSSWVKPLKYSSQGDEQ